MLDHQHKQTFWKSWKADCTYSMLNRRGAKTDPGGTPFLRRHSLLLLALTSSKGETWVLDKLHDHFDHVLIWKKSQAACR